MDPIISHHAAGQLIDAASIGLLATALIGTVSRRLDTSILVLAAQGLLLGVAATGAALSEMVWRSWAALLMAVAVKMILLPLFFWHVMRRLKLKNTEEMVIPQKVAFPLAAALIPFAYYAVDPLNQETIGGFDAPNAVPAALALVLLGLFTMLIRKKALTHIIGIITMENGLYLAAIAATRGLPFAVEFGVAVDVLAAVAMMVLVIREVARVLGGSMNVDRLGTLRG